jgi:putative addiction module antidote
MARELEIVTVGDSLGIALPADVLQRLGVEIGDTLSITVVSGVIHLSRCDFEDSEVMKDGQRVMREKREVLKRLADS